MDSAKEWSSTRASLAGDEIVRIQIHTIGDPISWWLTVIQSAYDADTGDLMSSLQAVAVGPTPAAVFQIVEEAVRAARLEWSYCEAPLQQVAHAYEIFW